MEWESYFTAKLEQSFDVVYLEGPDGALYGAGSAVDAVEVLRLAVGSEEMEHYTEVLVDDWAMVHLLDQVFGLETLIVFQFDGPDGFSAPVRYDLLDVGGDRVFVSVKSHESPLSFIAAADRSALGNLLSSLMLTLLGTNTAFGEAMPADSLPSDIVNYRPDLFPTGTIRRGIELLVERRREDGSTLEKMLDHVQRLGNPVLVSALNTGEHVDSDAARRNLVDLYFESVYSEAD